MTKEHIEKTNGYSNGYWDWGMEDDDLFWRCVQEGLVDKKNLDCEKNKNTKLLIFIKLKVILFLFSNFGSYLT